MPNQKHHKHFIGVITSITLLVLSLAILAISLFSANRKQAGQINQLTPEIVNTFLTIDKSKE